MSCSGWKEVTLGEILDLVIDYRGKTQKKLGGDWSNSGYRVLSAKNIKTGEIVQENAIRFVDEVLYKKWMKEEVNRGDIFITSEAPFGEIYYWDTEEKIVLGQRLFGLRIGKHYCSKYVYYYMTSTMFKAELDSRATGTTVVGLRQPELLKCKIKIPPRLEEQKIIAAVLSGLDDKIELNNRINKNLEKMAQAIFKRWFVDFEFPDENGNPYKSSGGEMVESELGEIPKGWRVEKVSEGFDISIGKTPPRKEPQWFTKDTRDVKWVSISDMGKSGLYIFDTGEYLTNEAIKKHNIKIVPSDTVILSFKLTIGRVAITSHSMTTNEAIAHFLTTDDTLKEFIYFYLKNFNFSSLGNTSSIATAVNSKVIKQMPILIPNTLIIHNFHHIASDLMLKIKNNQEEILCLINIRDSLLPKLMLGEIRVPCEEAV